MRGVKVLIKNMFSDGSVKEKRNNALLQPFATFCNSSRILPKHAM